MKPKNISLIAVLFCAGVMATLFQNCSKVAATEESGVMMKDQGNDVPVIARDDQGNLIPVAVGDPEQVIPPGSEPAGEHEVVVDAPPSENPPVPDSGGDMVATCGLDLKTIHNVVDLAQFKDQDVHLDMIQGKTLIYSSDPSISVKSLSVEVAVGRTILCGCKVDKLDLKKGRLEVYHSVIKELGERRGKLIKDAQSVVPAGI